MNKPYSNRRRLNSRSVLLSEAWATNSVNTVIFRHHGILTRGRYQYGSYYKDMSSIVVFQRDILSGSVSKYEINGNYNLLDAHNSISLGIDRNHHLHMSYDQHASTLRYRRARFPYDISSWSDEVEIPHVSQERVTYPTFIVPPDERPLMLLYRSGTYNSGEAKLQKYDESSQTWSNLGTFLSGTGQKPWTSNAYWSHPAVGRDGSLHLGFVWRISPVGKDAAFSNVNIDYAKSLDDGRSWVSSRGVPFSLPITQVNSETAWPVPPGSNLINQCGMALDDKGNPHIVYYADDQDGIVQYQHVWFDGKLWHHSVLSNRTTPFRLAGGGTLRLPISRPDIVIDDHGVAYVIYRGDLSENRLVAQRLRPPHYTPDFSDVRILWPHDLGCMEPIIDRLRWRQDRILSLLVQWNDQPDHDRTVGEIREPIFVVDVDVVAEWGD